VYQHALAIELDLLGIPNQPQRPVKLFYKGRDVGEGFLDFLVGDELIVELKSVDSLAPIHKAQVISYLRATGLHLGLLINFNVTILKDGVKRIILS
jgi:GxxExxY protein